VISIKLPRVNPGEHKRWIIVLCGVDAAKAPLPGSGLRSVRKIFKWRHEYQAGIGLIHYGSIDPFVRYPLDNRDKMIRTER
jgi:hypothetical protein